MERLIRIAAANSASMTSDPERNTFLTSKNKTVAKTKTAPTLGRYKRCSKMTSAMGIRLDSTESVRKNQRIPNAIKRNSGTPGLKPGKEEPLGSPAKGVKLFERVSQKR